MAERATRRAFLAGAAVAGTALVAGVACSSDGDDGDDDDGGAGDDARDPSADEGSGSGDSGGDGVIADGDVPTEATIFGWIGEVVDQGIRRPGYEADDWAVEWTADRFREHRARGRPPRADRRPAVGAHRLDARGRRRRRHHHRARLLPRPVRGTRRGARGRAGDLRPGEPGGGGGQGIAVRRHPAAPPRQLHGRQGHRAAGRDDAGVTVLRPRGHAGRAARHPVRRRHRRGHGAVDGGRGGRVHRRAHRLSRRLVRVLRAATTPTSATCRACGSGAATAPVSATCWRPVRSGCACPWRPMCGPSNRPTSSATCPAPTTRSC